MSEAKDVKKMTAETMSVSICEAVLKAVKKAKEPYSKMPELDQRQFINGIDAAIKQEIVKAVAVIAADKRTTVAAKVDQVVFKDGVKVVLKSGPTQAAHELADAEGQSVLIVITNVEKYEGAAAPKPEKDQKPLFDGTQTAGAVQAKDTRTKRSAKKKPS